MCRTYILRQLHYLPFVLALCLLAASFTAYGVAVAYGHVHPFVPYISDAATYSPQSTIFGQLMNFGSLISGLCMYFEYRFIKCHLEFTQKCEKHLNIAAFAIGMMATISVSFVGNFQVGTTLIPHMIFAFILFIGGIIYSILHLILTFRLRRKLEMSNLLFVIRICLTFSAVVCLMICIFAGLAAFVVRNAPGTTKWNPSHPDKVYGYNMHVLSATMEWIVMFCLLGYFFSFIPDLNKIYVEPITVRLKADSEPKPNQSHSMIGATNAEAFENDVYCTTEQI